MTDDEVREVARELLAYATHFSARDWEYTRNLGSLREIRHDNPNESFRLRLASAWGVLTDSPRWLSRAHWLVAWRMLARDKNLPDGVLDGGSIITYWEEDGEYLQYVQPSVGALIAEWLTAEPSNPHAQRIAGEMKRIQDAYEARLRAAAPPAPDGV